MKSRLRFLFVASRYHIDQHFAAKALVDAGHEVLFLTSMRSAHDVYDEHHPVIHLVAGKTPGRDFVDEGIPSLTGLWRQMKDLDPDVVVVRNPTYLRRALQVVVARLTGSTVILYDQSPMHRPVRLKGVIPQLVSWFAGAKWITPVLGRPDIHSPAFAAIRYVPFVMEPQTNSYQRHWFQDDAINVISVGRFEDRKDHRLFIRVVAELSKRYPIRATVIGECTAQKHRRELSEAMNLSEALGLGDMVRFVTNMQFSDVQQEYTNHDLFVLASRDEPASVSPLEAMAHSLPVICSDSNGTRCYIRTGENGYVFRTGDLDDLEGCMERIISDRTRLKEMGARSYELVISEHSPAKYVEKMVSIANGNG